MLDISSAAARLANALCEVTEYAYSTHGAAGLSTVLVDPSTAPACDRLLLERLTACGLTRDDVTGIFDNVPYVHLPGAFAPDDLPDTPTAFSPVPPCGGTLKAAVASVSLNRLLALETVAYRAENDGCAFVNLVALPGEGRKPTKSRAGMRGHTDAVSFPFPGTSDVETPRIAPSPDWVLLVCLRNPDAIPTRVTPLADILSGLAEDEISSLKEEQFIIGAQATFAQGLENILGFEHILDGAAILRDNGGALSIRYSHSNVVPSDDATAAARAAAIKLEELCNACAHSVALAPGDLLWVSNRLALHGRATVGGGIGDKNRWLLRTYALAAGAIQVDQRYSDSAFQLFP